MSGRGKLAPYGIVPMEVIQDRKLSRTDISVYAVISRFQGIGNNAYPSLRRIARELGYKNDDTSTVRRSIKKLVERGWVEILSRGNRIDSSVYACLHPYSNVLEVGAYQPPGVGAPQTPQVGAYQPPNKSSIQEQEKEHISLEAEPDTKRDLALIKETHGRLYTSLTGRTHRYNGKQTKIAKRLLMESDVARVCANLETLHKQVIRKESDFGWTFSMQTLDKKWEALEALSELEKTANDRFLKQNPELMVSHG